MIKVAERGPQTKKAASNEAAVPDAYRTSVKRCCGQGFGQARTILRNV